MYWLNDIALQQKHLITILHEVFQRVLISMGLHYVCSTLNLSRWGTLRLLTMWLISSVNSEQRYILIEINCNSDSWISIFLKLFSQPIHKSNYLEHMLWKMLTIIKVFQTCIHLHWRCCLNVDPKKDLENLIVKLKLNLENI